MRVVDQLSQCDRYDVLANSRAAFLVVHSTPCALSTCSQTDSGRAVRPSSSFHLPWHRRTTYVAKPYACWLCLTVIAGLLHVLPGTYDTRELASFLARHAFVRAQERTCMGQLERLVPWAPMSLSLMYSRRLQSLFCGSNWNCLPKAKVLSMSVCQVNDTDLFDSALDLLLSSLVLQDEQSVSMVIVAVLPSSSS